MKISCFTNEMKIFDVFKMKMIIDGKNKDGENKIFFM